MTRKLLKNSNLIKLWIVFLLISFVVSFIHCVLPNTSNSVFSYPLSNIARDISKYIFQNVFNTRGLIASGWTQKQFHFYLYLANAISDTIILAPIGGIILMAFKTIVIRKLDYKDWEKKPAHEFKTEIKEIIKSPQKNNISKLGEIRCLKCNEISVDEADECWSCGVKFK